MKDWVQGRPEVEVVDMALIIKNKIDRLKQHDLPVNDTLKEQLNDRFNDIITSLPEDLKSILQLS